MIIHSLADKVNFKFCKDCKHLIGRRDNFETVSKWKCGHPNNISGWDLVTGENIFVTYHIHDTRATTMCGPEGKWYEEYIPPVREYKPEPVSSSALLSEESFSAEALEIARDRANKRMAEVRAKKAARASLTTNDLENL